MVSPLLEGGRGASPPVAPDRGRALLQRERFLTDFRSLLKSVLPALYKKEMVTPVTSNPSVTVESAAKCAGTWSG
ncbi:hypothetical protein MASR2M17_17830 [Aminivibrio sp.]